MHEMWHTWGGLGRAGALGQLWYAPVCVPSTIYAARRTVALVWGNARRKYALEEGLSEQQRERQAWLRSGRKPRP